MICRSCGTEIADKAIICYRCGAATTDPVRKPVAIRKQRGRLVPLVLLVLLVVLGVYLVQAGQTVLPAGRGYGLAAAVVIVVAIVLLLFRIARRR